MHLIRRRPNWGDIKNILIIILVIFEVIIFVMFNNKCNQLKNTNNELNLIIQTEASTIEALSNKNNNLNSRVSQLEKSNRQLKEEKDEILKEKNQLLEDKTRLENELKTAKKQSTANKTTTNSNTKTENKTTSTTTSQQTNTRDFKSYMSYKAITNKSSKQWALQQQATTDKNGLRCIDGRPMVAVGTGWGLSVGDRAIVTCSNGNSFAVVIGDIKSNRHTLADNKTTASNGCRCEFIVDIGSLNPTIKSRGSVSALSAYSGYVVSIK